MDIRIFCDESCHLQNDGIEVMALGAMWAEKSRSKAIAQDLKGIKIKHKLPGDFEIKWSKVSPARVDFYLDLVRYFFQNPDLGYRAVVVLNKSALDHDAFDQDHDTWYYKMYYQLLRGVILPENENEIFLDIKDTRSHRKVAKLHLILRNQFKDLAGKIIPAIQPMHSNRNSLIQLCDLFTGAMTYANRGLSSSAAKNRLIEEIRSLSHLSLYYSTSPTRGKMNLFFWQPSNGDEK